MERENDTLQSTESAPLLQDATVFGSSWPKMADRDDLPQNCATKAVVRTSQPRNDQFSSMGVDLAHR